MYDGEQVGQTAEVRADFFEADHEYNDGGPYRASETVRTFRCGWVGMHPATGEKVAFGFMHSMSHGWGGTGMGQIHWDEGWQCSGRWPLAGGGGVGDGG